MIKLFNYKIFSILFFATPHARLKTKSSGAFTTYTFATPAKNNHLRGTTSHTHVTSTHTQWKKNKTLPRLLYFALMVRDKMQKKQAARTFHLSHFRIGPTTRKGGVKTALLVRERNTLSRGSNNSDLEVPNQVWRSGSVMCIYSMMIIHLTRSFARQ